MAKSMVKMQVLAPSAIKAEAEGGFMEFLREGAVSSELPLETYATAVDCRLFLHLLDSSPRAGLILAL
jgi:hypothetical protein